MRLLKVTARNFRTLENLDIAFSSYYCTISGKNNAGKSCIITLLLSLLEPSNRGSWRYDRETVIDYNDDRTKWIKGGQPIEVSCEIELSREDDPALLSYIEKQADRQIEAIKSVLRISATISSSGQSAKVEIDGQSVAAAASKDILQKIRTSNVLFTHNSSGEKNEIFLSRGRAKAIYEVMLSSVDQGAVAKAQNAVQRKIRRLAKDHRDDLNQMLGKLSDRYDVEFSALEDFATHQMPLGINLRDKAVEVPLNSWGSGTQNRTWVLMSILQANRIKTATAVSTDERTTPIVLIEEPESFLHPSAQSEFGRLLQSLSRELGIQIIVSTHSPYMLNQTEPAANILLQRRCIRGVLRKTEVINTSGKDWMAPFAEHLGVTAQEFPAWQSLFDLKKPRAVLVEGDLDREYFEHLRNRFGDSFGVPEDVEIVAYGGKDALKNTVLLRFALRRLEKYFVTFDLDSATESSKALERLGLREGETFLPIGANKPGKQAIEGLLPDRVINAVNGRSGDLVMQAMSARSDERNEAKRQLKRAYLEECKNNPDLSSEDFKHLLALGKRIGRRFTVKE